MIMAEPVHEVDIQRLKGADPDVALPGYASARAAGMDVRANLPEISREEGVTLAPGERVLVPTGFAIALPAGFEMQVRPRSGLALKHGLTLVNAPGTIDADYRGEVGVILVNHGNAPFVIEHGMRIAQLVLAPVQKVAWRKVQALSSTARGEGGFGSTGT